MNSDKRKEWLAILRVFLALISAGIFSIVSWIVNEANSEQLSLGIMGLAVLIAALVLTLILCAHIIRGL